MSTSACRSTASASTRPGSSPPTSTAWRTCVACRFSPRTTCATTSPTASSPCRMRDVVRVHASSGTTGKPTVVGYTRNDLETWAEAMARLVAAAGVTADDIAQVSFGYGLLHRRLRPALRPRARRRHRAAGLRRQHRAPGRDHAQLRHHRAHLHPLLRPAHRRGGGGDGRRPARDCACAWGLFGAEPWSESMRREIEARLGVFATDNYGLSEVIGPGISGECEVREGMHINEDHFLVESIDPETGRARARGRDGRAGVHQPDQGGVPGRPLPHARHLAPTTRAAAPAGARRRAWRGSSAAPTTC